jgi:hypothetical protein
MHHVVTCDKNMTVLCSLSLLQMELKPDTLKHPKCNQKQDRQCTYNVTLRCTLELLLPWKSNKYYVFVWVCLHMCGCRSAWVCACVCIHVALLIQHATRMHHIVTVWPLWLHQNFQHYPINGAIFGKSVLNIKRVF